MNDYFLSFYLWILVLSYCVIIKIYKNRAGFFYSLRITVITLGIILSHILMRCSNNQIMWYVLTIEMD